MLIVFDYFGGGERCLRDLVSDPPIGLSKRPANWLRHDQCKAFPHDYSRQDMARPHRMGDKGAVSKTDIQPPGRYLAQLPRMSTTTAIKWGSRATFSHEIDEPNNNKRNDNCSHAESEYALDIMTGNALSSLPGWYYRALLRTLGRTHEVLLTLRPGSFGCPPQLT